jgi:hypothetical protein
MALIPPEAGLRLRMQTESSLVQPLAPVKGIPADLPELQVGQAFTARIQESLPDNTYRALVAGRQLTLQLPEGASPGDTLELVLVDRTPRTLIAKHADSQAASTLDSGQPYPYSRISSAGRMISQLLLPDDQAPSPAPLNRGQPLLAEAPGSAAQLAASLAKAVSQSGLFYEAHQAQWLTGQRPLAALREEPQGKLPATHGGAMESRQPVSLTEQAELQAQPQKLPSGAADEHLEPARQGQSGDIRAAATASPIPEELRPLVQQQLDAVASQRLAWHGEAWPGQTIDWQIERERAEDRDAGQGGEASQPWSTTLRLTMPRLGTIDAALRLDGGNLRVRMLADDETALADLRGQSAELARNLADAGVNLQALEIRSES